MAKPSIFSRNYEQKMKRRKLNLTLFILLIICIAFFGGTYYLKKNNIKLFNAPKKETTKKEEAKPNKEEAKPNKESEQKPATSSKVLDYTYNLSDGKAIKLQCSDTNGNKEITAFAPENLDLIEYAISPNKKNAVFVDKSNQSLILVDTDGKFTDITKPNVVYKDGKKITRSILEKKPDLIWNGKPQFTANGDIVYVSNLPSTKVTSDLTLWITKPVAGDVHTKVVKLTNNINDISFEGFDGNNNLQIKTPNGAVLISPDGKVVK